MSDSNNPPKEAAAGSSGPRFNISTPSNVGRSYVNNSPVFPGYGSGTNAANAANAANATSANNANNVTNPTVATNATAQSDTTDSDCVDPSDSLGIHPQRMPDGHHFDKTIPLLIQPDSLVSRTYPLLHRVIAGRLRTSLALRGGRPVSRCSHKYSLGASRMIQKKYRPDSHCFQMNVRREPSRSRKLDENQKAEERLAGMCKRLRRTVRLSGRIGSGGFGTVFLAHKHTPNGQANFAIKVQEHNTIATMEFVGQTENEMMFFEEGGNVSNPPLCLH